MQNIVLKLLKLDVQSNKFESVPPLQLQINLYMKSIRGLPFIFRDLTTLLLESAN